jgi:hypothetical protein
LALCGTATQRVPRPCPFKASRGGAEVGILDEETADGFGEERQVVEEELHDRRKGDIATGGKDARFAVFGLGDGDGDVFGFSHDVPDPVTVWDWSLLKIVRRLDGIFGKRKSGVFNGK